MQFLEGTIPKALSDLKAWINTIMMRAPTRHFPESFGHDFDGIFYSVEKGIENQRMRFGDAKADQLVDMLRRAKAHYEAGENKLGGALMQDIQTVIMDRQPWAYPKELYRWPINPSFPELSEADLVNRGDESA